MNLGHFLLNPKDGIVIDHAQFGYRIVDHLLSPRSIGGNEGIQVHCFKHLACFSRYLYILCGRNQRGSLRNKRVASAIRVIAVTCDGLSIASFSYAESLRFPYVIP